MVNVTKDNETFVVKTDGVATLGELIQRYTEAALVHNARDVTLTAVQLGIDRNTLYRKLRRWKKEGP